MRCKCRRTLRIAGSRGFEPASARMFEIARAVENGSHQSSRSRFLPRLRSKHSTQSLLAVRKLHRPGEGPEVFATARMRDAAERIVRRHSGLRGTTGCGKPPVLSRRYPRGGRPLELRRGRHDLVHPSRKSGSLARGPRARRLRPENGLWQTRCSEESNRLRLPRHRASGASRSHRGWPDSGMPCVPRMRANRAAVENIFSPGRAKNRRDTFNN